MRLFIYCDGGLGNRLNSLWYGLSLLESEIFVDGFEVFWPTNSYCAAAYSDLFDEPSFSVKNVSLVDVYRMCQPEISILQDQMDAHLLGIQHVSASMFRSQEELLYFFNHGAKEGASILFYAGVLPSWVDMVRVLKITKKYQIKINQEIIEHTQSFIETNLPKAYYFLHLRRTDNPIGYTTTECYQILASFPEATFFMCSDSVETRLYYRSFKNIVVRNSVGVEKRCVDLDYREKSVDSDGRLSPYNVFRSRDNVIDGLIDMLIMSRGNAVGLFESGSTFQRVSKVLRELRILEGFNELPLIPFTAINDIKRFVRSGGITPNHIEAVFNNLLEFERLLDAYHLFLYIKNVRPELLSDSVYGVSLSLRDKLFA